MGIHWAWAMYYGGFPTPNVNPRRPYPCPKRVGLIPVATSASDNYDVMVRNYRTVLWTAIATAKAKPGRVVLKLPSLTPPFTAYGPRGRTVGEVLFPLAARALHDTLEELPSHAFAVFRRIEVPDFSPTKVFDHTLHQLLEAKPQWNDVLWTGRRARVDFLKFSLRDPADTVCLAAYPSRFATEKVPGMFDRAVASNTIF